MTGSAAAVSLQYHCIMCRAIKTSNTALDNKRGPLNLLLNNIYALVRPI